MQSPTRRTSVAETRDITLNDYEPIKEDLEVTSIAQANAVLEAKLNGHGGLADALKNGYVLLGMTMQEVFMAKGGAYNFTNISKSVHSWGTLQTLKCGGTYYYFEDGILVSYGD